MSEVQRLQHQLDGNKRAVARRDAYERLSKNKDFKSLVLEEFMIQECARYVHASGEPNLGAAERADALSIAQAAGHLKRFFAVICKMGEVAESTIVELEEAIVASAQEIDYDEGDE